MFINTEVFQENANYYRKHKRYPDGDPGSYEWHDYWNEEHRRFAEGYEVGGVRITGEHYIYSNYCPIIQKEETYGEIHKNKAKHAKKVGHIVRDFPQFWDEDYKFFMMLEIAREGITLEDYEKLPIDLGLVKTEENLGGAHHFLWLKPRGVGASYKGAVRPLCNQLFVKDSKTFVVADNKEYLTKDGLLNKYHEYKEWINEHASGFQRNMSKTDMTNMQFVCSYFEDINGKKVEKGMLSHVFGITMDGDPDKIRGKRGDYVWEEFGNFRKVSDAWKDAMNAVEEYGLVYGQMIGYGTGNLKPDNFSSLEKMFYEPHVYNILQIVNQWDELLIGQPCAHFTPAYCTIQHRDEHGNSDKVTGKEQTDMDRAIAASSKDPLALPQLQAQKPYAPAEAMLNVGNNIFPVAELKAHKHFLESTGIYKRTRMTVDLIGSGFSIQAVPTKGNPYDQCPPKQGEKRDGCTVIYGGNHPILNEDKQPVKNLYRICLDPYRHDTNTGESVGACYVIMNSNNLVSSKGDIIVASYIGRPHSQPEFNRQVFLLAQYYGARIGFENDEPGGVVEYAKTHKLLHLLEEEFELAYDANLKTKNTTRRSFGMHMGSGKNNLRKMQGDKYIQEWLLRPIGETESGEIRLNLHRIYDIGLLEELIRYNDTGNFDRVSSLRVGMYYERELVYKNRRIGKKNNSSGKKDIFSRFADGEFYDGNNGIAA